MMFTYEEARAFVAEASKSGSALGLGRIRRLMELLGNVQEEIPVIHITGTNGKGSVGAYLYYIFREAGLHVGRFCSPVVFDPMEAWQYDGDNICPEEYAALIGQIKEACDRLAEAGDAMPTAFEIETAAAFLYFYRKKPDVLLMEVGMGGETDATNIITQPIASVITKISMDHMQYLGSTLEEIASVKAGIIKRGRAVFSSDQEPEVKKVLTERAEELECPIRFVNPDRIRLISLEPGRLRFQYKEVILETSMAGMYQMENASLAMVTAYALLPGLKPENNYFKMKCIMLSRNGIAKAKWPGRFEVIGRDPLFIIDGAHNQDAAVSLAKTMENCFTNQPVTYIIGVLADKEHGKMLKLLLPYAKRVFTVKPNNPRALSAIRLAQEARQYHRDVVSCPSVATAVQRALDCGEPVVAFGSLSYLAEICWAYGVCTETLRRRNGDGKG